GGPRQERRDPDAQRPEAAGDRDVDPDDLPREVMAVLVLPDPDLERDRGDHDQGEPARGVLQPPAPRRREGHDERDRRERDDRAHVDGGGRGEAADAADDLGVAGVGPGGGDEDAGHDHGGEARQAQGGGERTAAVPSALHAGGEVRGGEREQDAEGDRDQRDQEVGRDQQGVEVGEHRDRAERSLGKRGQRRRERPAPERPRRARQGPRREPGDGADRADERRGDPDRVPAPGG